VPSINFTMFIEAVENGIAQANGQPLPHHGVRPKRQTIRAVRKVPIKPGDTLHLFTGMRTKGCRKIGEVTCRSLHEITIDHMHGKRLSEDAMPTMDWDGGWIGLYYEDPARFERELAKRDGFANAREMYDWFERTHGLPFHGVVVRW